jgi:pyruvyltransferase
VPLKKKEHMSFAKTVLKSLRPTIGRRVEEGKNFERLVWWQPRKPRYWLGKVAYWKSTYNVGDDLSPIVVRRILETRSKRFEDMNDEHRLLAIGSILHLARDGDTVWGSGINGKIDAHEYRFTSLDVRAVRGPLTRQFLLDRRIACPAIYGDPALLVPLLFPEFRLRPRYRQRYIIVPHLHETALFAPGPEILYPTRHWRDFIPKIIAADFVISSSLHGIILAEAFGIPARLLRLTSHEPILKYQDYYYGTGRDSFLPAANVEAAIEMGGEQLPKFDVNALVEAFPFDLWSTSKHKIAAS